MNLASSNNYVIVKIYFIINIVAKLIRNYFSDKHITLVFYNNHIMSKFID